MTSCSSPKAAIVGVFDGVHRGHRHLLEQLRTLAAERGMEPVVVTFDRHPLSVVSPDRVPPAICSLEERLQRLGVEAITLPFTAELRQLTAREFLRLLRNHGITLLLMGFNNRIGSDRLSGADLRSNGEGVEVLTASAHPQEGVCSSAVRQAVSQGDMEAAAQLLGSPFSYEATVEHGKQLGRTIGFPTANLQVLPDRLIPPPGVYAGRALDLPCVVNIGHRPTVDSDGHITIEAHIIGYEGDLYDRPLRVEFLRRLRGEKKFASLDQLKQQIQEDVNQSI